MLRLFEIDCVTEDMVQELGGNHPDGAPDEIIIPWLVDNGRIWITKDWSARKQHRDLLASYPASVIYVRMPKRGLNNWEQTSLMFRAFQSLNREFLKTTLGQRFRLTSSGNVQLLWQQTS